MKGTVKKPAGDRVEVLRAISQARADSTAQSAWDFWNQIYYAAERAMPAPAAAGSTRLPAGAQWAHEETAPPQLSYSVNVYRDASGYDCTNQGVTARYTDAMLYRSEADVPAEPPKGRAILVMVDEPVLGKPYLKAKPAGETRWTMFGGNFVWSCDSRFRQEVSERPIPVHDRIEG